MKETRFVASSGPWGDPIDGVVGLAETVGDLAQDFTGVSSLLDLAAMRDVWTGALNPRGLESKAV